MNAGLRAKVNAAFSQELYEALLAHLGQQLGEAVDFRVAESPVFVEADLRDQLVAACNDICAQLLTPEYFAASTAAIPPHQFVPGNDAQPTVMIIDFAVCKQPDGRLYPQVIELQGFPSLFCYQTVLAEAYQRFYELPANYQPYLSGYTQASFVAFLQSWIKGKHAAENVVLLELEPEKQKTRADFQATELLTGVRSVCLSKLKRQGKKLFYEHDGALVPIYRLYNRVIFDELEQRPELIGEFDLTQEVDVEWVCHPNWYFRMSKYSLPFLKSRFVPESHFVHQLTAIPSDLENWVLKPLYSFAGAGVIVDVTEADITALTHPEHYLLQRKVEYAGVLESPEAPVKVEIRMMVFLPEGESEPQVITNLARMSRGKLIGVRYNKDFNWVGGSSAFFEQ
jgi:hypothetical protein